MLDHLSDRELEEIYKKVSESREFEYNPDAWMLIKPRLEKKKRNRKLLFWLFGLGVSTLLLSGLFYMATRDLNKAQPSDIIITSDIIKNDLAQSKEESDLNDNDNTEKSSVSSSVNNVATDVDAIAQKDNSTIKDPINEAIENGHSNLIDSRPNNQSTNTNSSSIVAPNLLSQGNVNSPSNTSDDIRNGEANSSILKSDLSSQSNINSPPNTSDDSLTGTDTLLYNSSSILERTTGSTNEKDDDKRIDKIETNFEPSRFQNLIIPYLSTLPIQLLFIDQETIELPFEISNTSKDTSNRKPFIGIELSIGREWSTANTTYFRSGDTKLGLALTYSLSNKLALITGLGYKTDNYSAGRGAYKAPPGFWTDGIAPKYTAATCQIIDIPIGLNYHYSGINESGFFSTIAVTSIFMLREDYSFSYEDNTTEHVEEWSGVNANNHLFNDLYISSGYKLKLSDKYFIKLAPYFQIPLKGIGHGNLKLHTLGAKFSILLQTSK